MSAVTVDALRDARARIAEPGIGDVQRRWLAHEYLDLLAKAPALIRLSAGLLDSLDPAWTCDRHDVVRDAVLVDRVETQHRQGPRPGGTWGCACGWVQDRPHRDHVDQMIAEARAEPRWRLTDLGHRALGRGTS